MEGMDLLRAVTRQAWLQQPAQDLTFFADHHCKDAWYSEVRGKLTGLYQYDKNAAYLACASSVLLGVGTYTHGTTTAAAAVADKRPGIYLVELPSVGCPVYFAQPGRQWLYTPCVSYLQERGLSFDILEGYYWPESHTVLRAFYQHCKAQREGGQPIKHIYTQVFGMLAHDPLRHWQGMIYRPDWYNLLKAELKARMYRHAYAVKVAEGVAPVAIHIDALFYQQPVHSLKMGEGIGAFKEIPL